MAVETKKPRLTREEWAAQKETRRLARIEYAKALLADGCPAVFTAEDFADLITRSAASADKAAMKGLYPTQFQSGKLGYRGQGKTNIGDKRAQVMIYVTILDDKSGVAPSHDEMAELEALSNDALDATEQV